MAFSVFLRRLFHPRPWQMPLAAVAYLLLGVVAVQTGREAHSRERKLLCQIFAVSVATMLLSLIMAGALIVILAGACLSSNLGVSCSADVLLLASGAACMLLARLYGHSMHPLAAPTPALLADAGNVLNSVWYSCLNARPRAIRDNTALFNAVRREAVDATACRRAKPTLPRISSRIESRLWGCS